MVWYLRFVLEELLELLTGRIHMPDSVMTDGQMIEEVVRFS
jgi:hypothetical protein